MQTNTETGGVKAAAPNARIYLEVYFRPEGFDAEKYCSYKPAFNYYSEIDYVNYIAYMAGCHHYLFDQKQLLEILSGAGFKKVRLRGPDPEIDLQAREHESIYAVGEK